MITRVDLVKACQAFVHVGEHGSFTSGAAAAQVPQPVASRRIAALEEHFGQPLFDRSARRAAVLTAFGRDMLEPARRLVRLAEALDYHAAEARLRPLTLAMPQTCDVGDLARLDAAAREAGFVLDIRGAGPSQRAELLRSREIRVAIEAVPSADASWVVPLGVASATSAARARTPPFGFRRCGRRARRRRIAGSGFSRRTTCRTSATCCGTPGIGPRCCPRRSAWPLAGRGGRGRAALA